MINMLDWNKNIKTEFFRQKRQIPDQLKLHHVVSIIYSYQELELKKRVQSKAFEIQGPVMYIYYSWSTSNQYKETIHQK